MTDNNKPNDRTARSNDRDTTLQSSGSHTRAKNQTVMLTPEITGQVRAMLQQEATQQGNKPQQVPPLSGWDSQANLNSTSAPVPAQAQVLPSSHQAPPPVVNSYTHKEPPASAPQKGVRLVSQGKKGKLVGFMISYDREAEGEMVEIRSGRWILSSKPSDQGNTIVVDHDSVSILHAILRVSPEGDVQVMDQLAEFGTSVYRQETGVEEDVVGSMVLVSHGDVLRFGEMTFVMVLIPSQINEKTDDN